jgi:DNA (cytosine-5)-methyltransferase 1
MKYLSLFSGIGGFELGIIRAIGERADFVAYSEIDKYAIQIYEKQFPEHKNFGDITKIKAEELPEFDFLCGGFPCPSYSIAGKRKGLDDPRGQLVFDIIRILRCKKPKMFLLENVKGLLSHDKGRTMEIICEELCACGYAIDFEVLNAKNFGVAQNRDRVFIIGFRLDLLDESQLF